MALYMISGKVSEDCNIKVIQNDEFKAEQFVPKGYYIIYFESDNDSVITAAAENKDGILISFGVVSPIEVLKSNVLSKES